MPLLNHAVGVLQQQVPNHPMLNQLREMFTPAEPPSSEAEEEAIDIGTLIRSVLRARREGEHLTDEARSILKTLSEAGSPHDRVADFLVRLVSESAPPQVPLDLPEEIVKFLVQVRELAFGESIVREE